MSTFIKDYTGDNGHRFYRINHYDSDGAEHEEIVWGWQNAKTMALEMSTGSASDGFQDTPDSLAFVQPLKVASYNGALITDFQANVEKFINGQHITREVYPNDINLLEFVA